MKEFTLFSLAIILIIGGCARNKPVEKTVLGMGTDYYYFPNTLKGKVKEIKELNYWGVEKDGNAVKGNLMTKKDLDSVDLFPNLIAYFNDKGMLTRYDQLDGEKVTRSRIFTVENGKWSRIDYKIKDSTTSYAIPQYDNSGYFKGTINYRPLFDTLINKMVVSHDSKGNFAKFEFYNYKNKKTRSIVCTLDEKGNIHVIKYLNQADSLTSTVTNTFDKNGSLIRQVSLNEKTKSTSTFEYKVLKLDKRGNVIQYYGDVRNGKYKVFFERIITYY